VHLGMLEGLRVLYLERLTGRDHVPLPSVVGDFMPAHATALGKVLLAFAPPGTVAAVLEAGLAPLTPYTITAPRLLIEQLVEIRRTGVGAAREEAAVGPVRRTGDAISAELDRRRPATFAPAARRQPVTA